LGCGDRRRPGAIMRRHGASLAGRLWNLVDKQTWPQAHTKFVSPAAVSYNYFSINFSIFQFKLIYFLVCDFVGFYWW
jgi:hypothetical protein